MADVSVAFREGLSHLVRSSAYREGFKHLVRNEVPHLPPLPGFRHAVEFALQVAPAVHLKDAAVSGSRRVEGDPLAHSFRRTLDLLVVVAGDNEVRGRDLKRGLVPA